MMTVHLLNRVLTDKKILEIAEELFVLPLPLLEKSWTNLCELAQTDVGKHNIRKLYEMNVGGKLLGDKIYEALEKYPKKSEEE